MPSKRRSERNPEKASTKKRASLPRESRFTKSFKNDWRRYDGAGRFPMADIKKVMGLVIDNDGPLPEQYRDHELKGRDWEGHRECHVHGDLLLIYRLSANDEAESVTFVAIGTHAELFRGK